MATETAPNAVPEDWLEVTDPRAAAFLTDPETSLYLKPFLGTAGVTVGEAAQQLGVPATRFYHRVVRMKRLGLLEVSGTLPRRGRALKLYRATAERFFVPFSHTSAEDLAAFVRHIDALWYSQLVEGLVQAWTDEADAPHWGLNITKSDEGLLLFGFSRNSKLHHDGALYSASGVIYLWDTRFNLSEEDVHALHGELKEVLTRYRDKRSGPRQVLRLALAPQPPDETR